MDLRERARELDWYHTLELGPGEETEGIFDLRGVVDRYELPERMDGMRALDVGTWDGFWAFEMERRGAEVTALDLDDERDLDWPVDRRPTEPAKVPRGAGFRLAKEALGSKVERVDQSIYTARPEDLGTFDLVFCGSVLIHLRDQLLALERIAALTAGRFISVESYDPLASLLPFPAARFRARRGGRSVVFWEPGIRAWKSMMLAAGFDDVRRGGRFKLRARAGWSVRHVVLHATKAQGGAAGSRAGAARGDAGAARGDAGAAGGDAGAARSDAGAARSDAGAAPKGEATGATAQSGQ